MYLFFNKQTAVCFIFLKCVCLCVSPSLTLVIEAVDAVDGGTLVVAPQQEEVLGVFDLVGQQEADGLQRLFPSVHVVAQEQVVTLGRETAVLEEPQQIVVLTVNVTWTHTQAMELQNMVSTNN